MTRTFFLQHGNTETEVGAYRKGVKTTVSDPRTFLDDHLHQVEFENRPPMPTAELIVKFEAPDWLDARMQAEVYVI